MLMNNRVFYVFETLLQSYDIAPPMEELFPQKIELSEEEARKAVMIIIKELKKSKLITSNESELKVQNIVASANLFGKIDLERTVYTLEKTMYEPDQFPGLIYRMDDPKVVILLFASGKLVCTGAKKEENVYEAVTKLHETLELEDLIYYE